jgi:hypothetical protein
MESVRELFLTLGLDADESKFASAQLAVDGLEKGLGFLVDAAQALASFLVDAVQGTEEYGSKVADLSARSGIATDALQGIGYAAEQSGSTFEDATRALEVLGKTMGEAKGGSAEAQAAFAKLGVRVTDASGNLRDSTEVMYEAADGLLKLPEGAERSNAAMAVFGRGAKALGGLLSEGGAGIRAMAQEAQDLDLIMSTDSVKAADTFGDSMGSVHRIVARFSQYIGETLIPVLQPMLDGFKEWWKANNQLVRQRVEKWLEGVIRFLKGTAAVVEFVVKRFEDFVNVLKFIGIAIASYVVASGIVAISTMIGMVAAAAAAEGGFIALGVSMVAAGWEAAAAWGAADVTVFALAGALVILALIVDDIYVTLQGGDSIMGEFGGELAAWIESWSEPSKEDNWLIAGIKKAWWYLNDIQERLLPAIMGKRGYGSAQVGEVRPGETPEQAAARLGGHFVNVANGASAFGEASLTPQGTAQSQERANYVMAQTNVTGTTVTVHAAPGQDAHSVGVEVTKQMDTWWSEKASAAHAVAGVKR